MPKPNTNVLFSITLKSKEHIMYLWSDIYKSICSNTSPYSWPNPKTGKIMNQYHFTSRSLASLTEIYKQWDTLDKDKNKFIKIVPSNIEILLTPLGLALWIMVIEIKMLTQW